MPQTPRSAAIGFAAGFVLVGFLLGSIVWAQGQTVKATNAWARRAPAMGGTAAMEKMGKTDKMSGDKGGMAGMGAESTGAVYVTLSNSGAQPDALVSASTDAAQSAELHETKHDGGVMKMRPVQTIPVPAGGKTELKPGGYHIMLMGLKHDLKPGDKIAVTLRFQRGGQVRVEAPVR
jgi:copper(I)-binding protein